jgi:hypothetical protein
MLEQNDVIGVVPSYADEDHNVAHDPQNVQSGSLAVLPLNVGDTC